LERLPGIISIGFLTVVAVLIGINFSKLIKSYGDFVIYCLVIFVYELILGVTSFLQINNHIIANINTLVYTAFTFYLISKAYTRYHQKSKTGFLFFSFLITILLVAWVLENFLPGNSIFVFHSLLPGFSSILIVLICVYLINVLIFTNNGSIWKDPDILIIGGVLVRSITFGFALWFLNFDYGFERTFVSDLLASINIGLCLSDLMFIFAIYSILKPEKKIIPVQKNRTSEP
jgi:hypothetical protein